MNKLKIIQQSAGTFLLSGLLNQHTIPDLWLQRATLTAANNALTIDLGEITHSDSAGLGFLTCLQSEAHKSNYQLTFINIPNRA